EDKKLGSEVALLRQRQETLRQERALDVLKKHHAIVVSGPPNFESGSVNRLKVGVVNGLGEPVKSKSIEARVVDREHDKVLFKEKLQDSEGTAELPLPADLAADAYAHLTLKIVASPVNGPSATLEEDFQLT